jgi:hypothetical protein
MFPGPAKKNKFLSSSTTTTTTTPKPRTVPEEPTTTAPSAKPNPFLSRALQQAQAQAPQQAQAQAPQQAQAQAPVEEFPVLSKGATSSTSVTATATTANAYKSALLSKIDITHAEEQARIQRAVRREMERNEERRRQLELAARRERFVNAAMNRVNGMAYDDDDDSNDIDVDNN